MTLEEEEPRGYVSRIEREKTKKKQQKKQNKKKQTTLFNKKKTTFFPYTDANWSFTYVHQI